MSESFDPYRKWLGIPLKDQPPHHYRLLGVPLFEDDPDVIENAADRQMAHVRSFQSGQNADVSQRLLNQLAAARVCLLNLQKKQEYDLHLQARLDMEQALSSDTEPPEVPPPTIPPPAPPPMTGLDPMAPLPVAAVAEEPAPIGVPAQPSTISAGPSLGRRTRRRRNRYFLPIALIILSVAALIAIAIVASQRNDKRKSTSYRALGARAISISEGIESSHRSIVPTTSSLAGTCPMTSTVRT